MIIAGGGIIGLSCAWRLVQRGLSVTLMDAGRLAGEASHAAAGMLAPGGECAAGSPLTEMSIVSLGLYAEFVRELEQESGTAIDYRMCGAVEVAFTDAEAVVLEARAGEQEAIGIHSERCLHDGHHARFYPGDALVNPRQVTAALIQACRLRGVEFREHEPLRSIATSGEQVKTALGAYDCDGVIVAAGAWSSALDTRLRRSFPVRGHLIGWQSEDALPVPILRNANTYVVRRQDGWMVAGSSTEFAGFDRAPDAEVLNDIRTRVARLLPSAPVDRAEAWNGLRPGVEGEQPAVGLLEGTRIFSAYGHYRNGILLAPETARQIDLLIGSS